MKSANMKQAIDRISPEVLKKYEISRKIGKGAYGVVWRVIERKTRKSMALKMLSEQIKTHRNFIAKSFILINFLLTTT